MNKIRLHHYMWKSLAGNLEARTSDNNSIIKLRKKRIGKTYQYMDLTIEELEGLKRISNGG